MVLVNGRVGLVVGNIQGAAPFDSTEIVGRPAEKQQVAGINAV